MRPSLLPPSDGFSALELGLPEQKVAAVALKKWSTRAHGMASQEDEALLSTYCSLFVRAPTGTGARAAAKTACAGRIRSEYDMVCVLPGRRGLSPYSQAYGCRNPKLRVVSLTQGV